jgi:hypothetical protein
MSRHFVLGVIVGVGGVWAYHKWVRPMSTSASK